MQNIHLEKLIKSGVVLAIVLSLFFLVRTINALKESRFIGGGVPASNVITVSGEGEVLAVPDVAEFSFSVVEEKQTVEAAQEAAAKKANDVLGFLKNSGIEEKDIRTTGYNLYPRYEFQQDQIVCITFPCPQPPGRQVLVGYEVNQSVSVKVRDTQKAGTILAGVGERGATNIGGIFFTIDDEDELKREARKEAIDDAKDKAKALADDLGVDLVRVVSFSDNGSPTPFFARGMGGDFAFEESAKIAPEIPVGENTITSFISITYEIR